MIKKLRKEVKILFYIYEILNNINNKKYLKTKKVFCENKIYNSITEASKDLNILRSTLTNRLKSKNFKNYYYI